MLNKGEELKINNEDKKATDKIDIVSLGDQRILAVRVSYQPPNNNKNNEIVLPRDYETLHNYAYIAIKLNKADLLNRLIENSSSEPIKKLINRMANREVVGTDEIIKISENEILKELTDILDPKKVHQYYQIIKAQNLAKLSKLNTQIKGWQLPKTYIDRSTTYLSMFKGIKCFGTIDPNLKVEENSEALNTALSKGFRSRAAGQNGVKPFRGKAFELKSIWIYAYLIIKYI